MFTDVFESRFGQLLTAARTYYGAPRGPEQVVELATARWNLEIARRDVAAVVQSRQAVRSNGMRRRAADEAWAARERLRVQGLGLTSC